MKPARKKRLIIVCAILVGMASAAALLFFAMGTNLNHFYEIKDIKSGKAPLNKQIRIGGMVEAGSIKRTEGNLKVSFGVTDYNEVVNVSYDGILPDLFREGQGVMATGILTSNDSFVAKEILAKHDENYMPSEVQEQLEKVSKEKGITK